ncbi:GNAT family N-acetyltransferase [Denitrobaculum tricleocarpae]|uniref:GNAT family N-acetyltransferase n=1 Tax=Denitrobaculum tricleocarpae TaxID=2591009 RepID=A0A545TMC9_9PROT|nr:GNAT family protein [Denitrobaculum tricleocarpae]TQV78390.1 GNAT family N-acetyltransferase [Denitrobaculum tricleocarpae]
MSQVENELGLPVGFPVAEWSARQRPARTPIEGRSCRVEPLDPERHAADLHDANLKDRDGRIWTYLPYGPFESLADFRAWISRDCQGDDPLFHAIVDKASGRAIGVASYLRIEPTVGVIEVGHINYAPELQKTAAATEAMYLLMRRVFDELGYRRYEWKCDALNASSRAAAARLGFQFEGIFRQATIYKGRNRDTAWFGMTDQDWPDIRRRMEGWLDPANFDAQGRQLRRLSAFG